MPHMKFSIKGKNPFSKKPTKTEDDHTEDKLKPVSPPKPKLVKPLPRIDPIQPLNNGESSVISSSPVNPTFIIPLTEQARRTTFNSEYSHTSSNISNEPRIKPIKRSYTIGQENFIYNESITQLFEDVSNEQKTVVEVDKNKEVNGLLADYTELSKHERIPSFIENSKIIYIGFGGWIILKKFKKPEYQNQLAVIKVFKRLNDDDKSYTEICENEFNISFKLKNRNIINVYNLCKDIDKHINKFYFSLCLPYYQYGDLFSLLTKADKSKVNIPDKIKNNFFKQMLSGVKFIHDKNIIHGDIKLDNFLIDDSFIIKLTDFGMSIDKELPQCKEIIRKIGITKIGTKSYRPPELFFNEKKIEELNFFEKTIEKLSVDEIKQCEITYKLIYENLVKIDVWSLGICYLILILNLQKPWDFADKLIDNDFKKYFNLYKQNELLFNNSKLLPLNNTQEINNKLKQLIENNPESMEFIKRLDFESRCVIIKMLNVEIIDRVNCNEVLSSDWITNIGFCSNDEFYEIFDRIFP